MIYIINATLQKRSCNFVLAGVGFFLDSKLPEDCLKLLYLSCLQYLRKRFPILPTFIATNSYEQLDGYNYSYKPII